MSRKRLGLSPDCPGTKIRPSTARRAGLRSASYGAATLAEAANLIPAPSQQSGLYLVPRKPPQLNRWSPLVGQIASSYVAAQRLSLSIRALYQYQLRLADMDRKHPGWTVNPLASPDPGRLAHIGPEPTKPTNDKPLPGPTFFSLAPRCLSRPCLYAVGHRPSPDSHPGTAQRDTCQGEGSSRRYSSHTDEAPPAESRYRTTCWRGPSGSKGYGRLPAGVCPAAHSCQITTTLTTTVTTVDPSTTPATAQKLTYRA